MIDTTFWLNRWKNSDIGFHQSEANALLIKFFPRLSLKKGSRILVPLCGKTRDIAWLLAQGYAVVGVELSQLAIEQLFVELNTKPEVTQQGELRHYRAENIDIFAGDIFHLSREVLGPVDAIYDRAALVALPEGIRPRYTEHLIVVTGQAPQLLITWVYDQTLMDGPPFSIDSDMVHQYYGESYQPTQLASTKVPGKLKSIYGAEEDAWLLSRPQGTKN